MRRIVLATVEEDPDQDDPEFAGCFSVTGIHEIPADRYSWRYWFGFVRSQLNEHETLRLGSVEYVDENDESDRGTYSRLAKL